MKIPLRVMFSPIILFTYLVVFLFMAIKGTMLFVRYGGEFLVYKKDDKATIAKIYKELKP